MKPPKLTCPDCGKLHWHGKRCTACGIKFSAKRYASKITAERRREYEEKRVMTNNLENEIIMRIDAMQVSLEQLKGLMKSYRRIRELRYD
jgi:hypothetical protein